MTKGAKTYIDAVVATGAAIIASAVLNWRSDNLLHYSVFLFFFLTAATLKCRVPGVTGTYSPVFFFALLGSATLSFSEVAIAAALAGVVQSTFRPKRRPSAMQVCFNAANLALSACAGFPIIQRQIPGLAEQPLMISLILGASVVYFVNTALVSVVLTLAERGSIAEVWKNWCLGSLPYYIIGAMIVAAAISAQNRVSAVATILIAPSILLITMYYRFWLGRAVEQPIQSQEIPDGS
jgi:hypothetical protein